MKNRRSKSTGSTPNRIRRSLASVAAVAVVSAAAIACGTDDKPAAAEKDFPLGTIRVYITVPHSPPFVAIDGKDILGTWKGSGLNVELIQGSTPKAGQAIASGQADVSLSGTTGFVGIGQGVPQVATASIMSVWTQVIIANPKLKAKSFSDLKGKNFGLTGASSPGVYTLKKVAEMEGWSESDYKTTTLGTLPTIVAALKSGSIDAFPWSIDEGLKLESQGLGDIVGDPNAVKEAVGPILFQGFMVRTEYASKNKEALNVFFTKYYDMVKKIKADPSLAAKVLEKWGYTKEVASKSAKNLAEDLSPDGSLSSKGVANSVAEAEFASGKSNIPAEWTYWKDLVK